jgi:hypothetical protein
MHAAKLFRPSRPEIAILILTAHFDAAEEVAKEAGILGVFAKDNVEPLVRRTRATPEMR